MGISIYKIKLNSTFSWPKQQDTGAAVCSLPCPVQHIRIPDTKLAQCCWSCQRCPENSVASNETCIMCKDTEQVSR